MLVQPFWILDCRFWIIGRKVLTMLDCFLFMPFLIINLRQFKILLAGLVPNPKSKIENPKLFDDLVCPRQHIGRDREADLLGSLEIDHQLELCRLLDGKVGGLGTF